MIRLAPNEREAIMMTSDCGRMNGERQRNAAKAA